MIDGNILEKIYELDLDGHNPDEIAKDIGNNICVQEFRECPSWCQDDVDCYSCWCKCIEIELLKKTPDIFTPPPARKCKYCKFYKEDFCTLTSCKTEADRYSRCTGFRNII